MSSYHTRSNQLGLFGFLGFDFVTIWLGFSICEGLTLQYLAQLIRVSNVHLPYSVQLISVSHVILPYSTQLISGNYVILLYSAQLVRVVWVLGFDSVTI